MQPKVYITDDHLLMELLRSIYYNIKYEITNQCNKWIKYRGEPLVIIKELENHLQWIRRLTEWTLKSQFKNRIYCYLERITVIEMYVGCVYYSGKLQEYIEKFSVEYINLYLLREKYLLEHLPLLGDIYLIYIMEEFEPYLKKKKEKYYEYLKADELLVMSRVNSKELYESSPNESICDERSIPLLYLTE